MLIYVACICAGGGALESDQETQTLLFTIGSEVKNLQNWKKKLKLPKVSWTLLTLGVGTLVEKSKAENCYNKLAELIIFKVCNSDKKIKILR